MMKTKAVVVNLTMQDIEQAIALNRKSINAQMTVMTVPNEFFPGSQIGYTQKFRMSLKEYHSSDYENGFNCDLIDDIREALRLSINRKLNNIAVTYLQRKESIDEIRLFHNIDFVVNFV